MVSTKTMDPAKATGNLAHAATLPSAAGSPDVMVEVVFLRTDPVGNWHYRLGTTPLASRTDPDHAARHVARLDQATATADHTVLHSTSWRYDPGGHLILTYAVAPDPDPGATSTPLTNPQIAHGATPAQPTPENLTDEHIAAHAVRHLALLANTDPTVAHALAATGLTASLAAHQPAPAGLIS